MMNPFREVDWNPDIAGRKKFAVSWIVGFPAIAIVFSIVTRIAKHVWNPFFLWLGIVGCIAGVVLWLLPQIAKPFYLAWYFVACCMGIVIGNVLFAILFYGVITPIGLAMRASGRTPMEKTFDRKKTSYWGDVEKPVDLSRYYRQF